ncbi:P-loop containing nucleoside triphosphate hydrolase protein [Immersiella caudata]|uniref:P-loop containing nucleoside triphosphate hydrolase protein n=1 Tax=Immersiella caudata TaxID=314043 RepID=A0AA40C2C0_9PEZI|nr:P-loop containing nucleoside triphosphate hydrolase protein [Immersiella caudata]
MEGLGVVLVMGTTGAGKSTFISHLKKTEKLIHIGHGLLSKTADLDIYEACGSNGRRVLLADTPGFDDTVRPDTNVLQSIVNRLWQLHNGGNPVHGVIYLHNITNPRLSGTGVKALKILEQLVGTENYGKIVFATTMWEEARYSPQGGKDTDQWRDELERDFWKTIFTDKCGVMKHECNEGSSAQKVLDYLLSQLETLPELDCEKPFRILQEMVDERMPIEKTGAYRCAEKEHPLARLGNEAGEGRDEYLTYGVAHISVDGKFQEVGEDNNDTLWKGTTLRTAVANMIMGAPPNLGLIHLGGAFNLRVEIHGEDEERYVLNPFLETHLSGPEGLLNKVRRVHLSEAVGHVVTFLTEMRKPG